MQVMIGYSVFRWDIRDVWKYQQLLTTGKALNGNFWPGPNARYFRFLENHDEERIAKVE